MRKTEGGEGEGKSGEPTACESAHDTSDSLFDEGARAETAQYRLVGLDVARRDEDEAAERVSAGWEEGM